MLKKPYKGYTKIVKNSFLRFSTFYFKIPKNEKLERIIRSNYLTMVLENPQDDGIHMSNYWKVYLPKVRIYLIPNETKPKKVLITHEGLTDSINLKFLTLAVHSLQILRNIYLLIRYRCGINIIMKTFLISIQTGRMLCFDMVKHAILVSRVLSKINLQHQSQMVVIGDGLGFLGTMLKSLYPNTNITFVNLPKNLFLDHLFFTKVFNLAQDQPMLIRADNFNGFKSNQLLFFNVASLSEMSHEQIDLYLNSIAEVGGTLVSLNRNTKNHPDGSLVNLSEMFDSRHCEIMLDENPCEFYSKFPLRGFLRGFLPFDGEWHLKILRFQNN
jgi:hypothetical protein